MSSCPKIHWYSLGASTIGPGHVACGLPNQDYWGEMHVGRYDVIVAADGLGSCINSDIGSRAVCESVMSVVEGMARGGDVLTDSAFLDGVLREYLRRLSGRNPTACATTCQIAICDGHEIKIFQIGDGLAAVLCKDGSVDVVSEDKQDGFSNLVNPLLATTTMNDWRRVSHSCDLCVGVVLCTDGIADDLADVEGFVSELLLECSTECGDVVEKNMVEMLHNWPVPKHTDDKTLVCLFRRGGVDHA